MDGASKAAAGANSSYIVKEDGSLWICGLASPYVQGHKSAYAYPVKIMDNVKNVCADSYVAVINKEDGSIYAWNGDIVQDYEGKNSLEINLEKITGDVVDVSMSGYQIVALKADGSLWIWGYNAGSYGKDENTMEPTVFLDLTKIYTGVKLLNSVGFASSSDTLEKLDMQSVLNGGSGVLSAKPANIGILLNGQKIAMKAYNIDGSNYFKLRDFAYILREMDKGFEVAWIENGELIWILSNRDYTIVGGELEKSNDKEEKKPLDAGSVIVVDDTEVKALKIDGYTYLKLRDMANIIDFDVDWDAENSLIIITTN